ncbi:MULTISPECIES: hydrogen peroxide-dependent heme synthase [unclassified Actinobaculum]|uniref:hydrogen peroxide-dependent heme synthase n=1 Tax=unclassified Actinobaculum TaxID=2609299 RepID=UPI00196A9A26|nr:MULTISPECIES: hydrogen peroxide-dependent heme synthase [unclassified Actinobaculum]
MSQTTHPGHADAQHAVDPRDTPVSPEEVNAKPRYVMYSVFRTSASLAGIDTATAEEAVLATGVTIRGWYDISGFRANADLMLWTLADDPAQLQAAYHALRRSDLGRALDPEWSCVGVHRPAEFNAKHTPACFSGVAPRPWVCVYPFVRSYDWYYMDEEKRSRILAEHGRSGREYPDVKGSTTSAFALNDYEWLLAFEADELHRLTDAMRHQRNLEARLHVRKEIPFFTGPRVTLTEWAERQG